MAEATPDKGRAAGKLERQLGFREARIFGRRPRGHVYDLLFRKVDHIIEEASKLDTSSSWSPRSAGPSIESAFHWLGPVLWPAHGTDRSAWLVDASANNWEGLYPRNLYYEVQGDQEVSVISCTDKLNSC